MSVKDEKCMATTETRMMRWAMGVSLLEHRRNEEILEGEKVEAIATVMRRRRLEWFGHVKRRGETENIRAVAEMKMEGKRPRGRPTLRWNDTVRRDLEASNIKEEWATDRKRSIGLCKTSYPEQGDGVERREIMSSVVQHDFVLGKYLSNTAVGLEHSRHMDTNPFMNVYKTLVKSKVEYCMI